MTSVSTARDGTGDAANPAMVTALEQRQPDAAAALPSTEVTRQHAFVQAVLDTIGVGIVACDADGHLTLFNQATRGFHGIPADPGVDPSDWADRFGLFAADGVTKLCVQDIPLARTLAEGAVHDAVITIAPDAGDPVVVRCEGKRLYGADGSVTGAVVAMTDITESLRAANRLQRAHADLTMALDAMPRSVTLVGVERDLGGMPVRLRIRWVNAHVRELLHLTLDQVVGRPFAEVFPAVAEEYELIYLQAAVTQEMLHVPVEWFSGDQISGAFEVTVSPWTDDGLLIDVVDVTARRSAENALRLSEKRLREAQSAAGLAGWDWDLRSGVLLWSPLMYEMLGVEPTVTPTAELVLSLVDPEGRATFEETVRSAIKGESTVTLDIPMIRPDGQAKVIRAHATIEREPGGRAVRVWGTDQDVTAASAREAALAVAAQTDSLTGLLNRRGWETQTAIRLDESGLDVPVAVAMIDLDHFKVLNDTYGHAAGDELLRECARQWSSRLRASDVIARVGGEEFAILLPGCDRRAAQRVVAALRESVPQPFTASAGVTCMESREALAAAMSRADEALYAAKAAGRNQLLSIDPDHTVVVAV